LIRNQPFQGTGHTMHDYVAFSVPTVNEFSGYSRNHLAFLCCLSLLFHTIFIYVLIRFAPMDFARPVVAGQVIYVDLKLVKTTDAQPDLTPKIDQKVPPSVSMTSVDSVAVSDITATPSDSRHMIEQKSELIPNPVTISTGSEVSNKKVDHFGSDKHQILTPQVNGNLPARLMSLPPPIRNPAEFFGAKHENLTFQLSMYGMPVGVAQLEATNSNGELRIISHVKSNAAFSLIYPVDNATETRMFNGLYIMTTIRRHEGDKQTDVGFTLCLGEKNVFWADRLNKRYYNHSVPTDQVMDTISGFYFLRNQQLEVGKSIVLNLFDNNTYAPTTVLVLRKERVTLANFREVETFVLQPQFATSGIYDKTGDLFIWLTADENRVPVKLETSIPIGRITAELVSAESEK
jgi:Protein of unknown function (DUF3108)